MTEGLRATLMVGAPPRRVDVAEGRPLVVGSCCCASCAVDVRANAAPGAWFRAVLTLEDDLRIANESLDADLWVSDLENRTLRVHVPAGRRRLVVPFEFSEASFFVGECEVSERLTLIGPEPAEQASRRPCHASVSTAHRLRLRAGTVGAAVLDELCARADEAGRPPTSVDIAERLGSRGLALTAKGVDRHVDHIFRQCFPEDADRARGWKRMALVSLLRRSHALR